MSHIFNFLKLVMHVTSAKRFDGISSYQFCIVSLQTSKNFHYENRLKKNVKIIALKEKK